MRYHKYSNGVLSAARDLLYEPSALTRREVPGDPFDCLPQGCRVTLAGGKSIHLLIVSNTDRGSFIGGADRDWVNLLNAIGPAAIA